MPETAAGSLPSTGVIQIAGVMDQAEADMLREAGADWLGFPFRIPVPEDLDERDAAGIIAGLPADCQPLLITYLDQARDIAALCAALGVRRVQIHGAISRTELAALRREAPGLAVIKSLVVRRQQGSSLFRLVDELADLVDVFLTDTYDPATGRLGATGLLHDWDVSRALVEYSPKPVILAGGLDRTNVAAAIESVQPAGVDAHTRLEAADGRKDPRLVAAFVAEARQAFNRVQRSSSPHGH